MNLRAITPQALSESYGSAKICLRKSETLPSAGVGGNEFEPHREVLGVARVEWCRFSQRIKSVSSVAYKAPKQPPAARSEPTFQLLNSSNLGSYSIRTSTTRW